MKKSSKYIKSGLITILFLAIAFGFSLLLQNIFNVYEHITTVFIFSVFLISLFTDGYFYGVLGAFIGTFAVNYAFTFPYYAFSFKKPVYIISGIIMIAISILTSALTTKLKKHEAMRVESEKEGMRANLLRAVSHDLRTPLTTIYGFSTTLLENETITDEQKKIMLTGIKEDSEWLIRMVENLLSITRIDSGQVKIIKTLTVLDELIDSVMRKFKNRYPNQKVEIEIPDEVIIIPMDAILIEQVIINILENAVQHAKGMTKLEFKVLKHGSKIVFEIRDNGCGINPKLSSRLFTGYYNSSEDFIADGQKKNAGIGLSVCAAIIKAHSGSIAAENLKTGGAVFRFALDSEDLSDKE